jgi:phage terminase large subunit-like protein
MARWTGPTLEQVTAELMRRELGLNRLEASESITTVREKCRVSFAAFVQEAWHVLEPRRQYVHGWMVDAICEHLECVTSGLITRLLINVPPGSAKSLLVSVFWPAWEWGPRGLTSHRYISTSFAESAVVRDVRKTRLLISSDWYQRHWPHVELTRAGELSFENSLTGTRDGVAFGSLTSRRGDRLIIDDPHSVEKAESSLDRERATRRFREGAVNRLNDQARSAIVIIMQRLHEADISGIVQDFMPDYVQLVLPMEYESGRHCETSIGFSDPRRSEGELLFPERWPRAEVEKLKRDMEKFAYAGQYQQRPAPRGGGLFPYNGWELWSRNVARTYGRNETQYPDFDYIVGSLDPAYGEKQANDFSAFVVVGCWTNHHGVQQAMLMGCWQKRLPIAELVEEIIKSCRKLKVHRLLVENKGSGISVAQEISRLTRDEEFALQRIDPLNMDKIARGNALTHLWGEEEADGSFRKGVMWVPAQTQESGAVWPRDWAELAMAQCASFPKGKHDDIPDAICQALKFLRDRGLLKKSVEVEMEQYQELMAPPTAPMPLYPI